jgi:hypothetical protein
VKGISHRLKYRYCTRKGYLFLGDRIRKILCAASAWWTDAQAVVEDAWGFRMVLCG